MGAAARGGRRIADCRHRDPAADAGLHARDARPHVRVPPGRQPDGSAVATFARASTATQRSSRYFRSPLAVDKVRDAEYVLNPVSGLYERCTLLEKGRTQLQLRSDIQG